MISVCEIVGVGYVENEQALARISNVNYQLWGDIDGKYVKQQRKITSYRTKYGEITPNHLENGMYYFKSTSLNFVFKQPCLAIVTSIIFCHNYLSEIN